MNREKYFLIAIDKGEAKSMYLYGCLLLKLDQFCKEDVIKYIKMVSDNDFDKYMNDYGNTLYFGQDLNINKKEAFKYFQIAADRGDIEGANNCAVMLYKGE